MAVDNQWERAGRKRKKRENYRLERREEERDRKTKMYNYMYIHVMSRSLSLSLTKSDLPMLGVTPVVTLSNKTRSLLIDHGYCPHVLVTVTMPLILH